MACRTEDELLGADVPPDLLELVIDNLYVNLAKAVEEPLYEVQQVSDLLRYREGELLDFLLHLDEEQRKLADWRLVGPSLIRGGPGTGKSTVALYRVKALVERWSGNGSGTRAGPRILFTTYTNSLIRSSRQLLEQLLGPRAEAVEVDTADRVAMRILGACGERPTVLELADARAAVREAIASVPPFADRRLGLARLRPDYWLEEFEWVIEGRGLSSAQEYLAVDRSGREVALRPEQRAAVWALYEAFLRRVQEHNPGAVTWGQVRRRALELVKTGQYAFRYDAVVVDEAQDLTPVALSLLAELSKDPSGLYLTADINQSLYARGVSWQQVSARLRLRGRSVVLRRNYRLSESIARAASAFLRAAWGADDGAIDGVDGPMAGGPLPSSRRRALADAEALVRECVHQGPPPVLMGYRTESEQYDRAAAYIRRACRMFQLGAGTVGVLAPTNAMAQKAAQELAARGIRAAYMQGREVDLRTGDVKVMTIHSAKGLEFPIVVVIGLEEGILPMIPGDATGDERREYLQAQARLFFVAMTRAMRGLLVLYSLARPSPFVKLLDRRWWTQEEGAR